MPSARAGVSPSRASETAYLQQLVVDVPQLVGDREQGMELPRGEVERVLNDASLCSSEVAGPPPAAAPEWTDAVG